MPFRVSRTDEPKSLFSRTIHARNGVVVRIEHHTVPPPMMPTPGPLEATPATLHSPESTSLGPSPLLTSTIASTRENTFHVYSVDNEGGIAEPCSSGDDGGVDAASAVVRGASGGDTGGEGEVKEEEEVENILASRGK